ncbi:uncharacterized protein LOC124131298 [Haliotis rufescens]|uniref:uncharacterized protein LOC124131298 n=1 Tax=Haliotis rufescens TaxID=6454 RepID=UPI00201E97EF|nr:uncharacterized protein LOC124131298 [Haliotis rufescens]
MKLLLLFVLVCLVAPSVGWRRRRFRFRLRKALTAVQVYKAVGPLLGKRDVASLDLNQDGYIDQSEAEEQLSKKDADALMQMSDEGDGALPVSEFVRMVHE